MRYLLNMSTLFFTCGTLRRHESYTRERDRNCANGSRRRLCRYCSDGQNSILAANLGRGFRPPYRGSFSALCTATFW